METKIKGSTIFQGSIFKVESHTVRLNNGKETIRDFVVFPEAVAIVPITTDGRIVLVNQYRYAVSRNLLELPAGKNENCENILECAKRELEEETSYASLNWEKSSAFYSTPGFSTEFMTLFFAHDVYKLENPQAGDDDENIEVELLTLEECFEYIREGRLIDGKSILGLLAYKHKIGNKII
ncbi:NUDIX domain-containing protein [Candidatus Riflebacteria bacterium]